MQVIGSACAGQEKRSCQLDVSHPVTSFAVPAASSIFPSGEKAMPFTRSFWVVMVAVVFASSAFQIRILLSVWPVANRFPSFEIATDVTCGHLAEISSFQFSVSQILKLWS